MSLVLSILALFVGLIAVYLAAESRQGIDEKIQKSIEFYGNATKNVLEDCVANIKILSERLESLESDTENLSEFKDEVTSELACINKKLSDIRHELILNDTSQPKKKIIVEPEIASTPK